MAHPVSKVLADIQKVQSWNAYQRIKSYVEMHSMDYSPSEYTELQDAISQKYEYFNPPDCSIITGLKISFEGHPDLVNLKDRDAQAICEEAKSNDMPLSDWIYQTYQLDGKAPTDYTLIEYVPSAYEKKLAQSILGSSTNAIGRILGRPATEKGALSLEVDQAALIAEMRKLREDFSEEAEDLRTGIERRLAELKEIIKLLKEGKGLPPSVREEIEKPYSVNMRYTKGEYRIFTKLIAGKSFPPIDIRVMGRAGNEIVLTLSGTKENVDRITNAVSERYAEYMKHHSHTSKISGIAEILCSRYEQSTGYKCNPAVIGLGNRIDKFLQANLGEYYDIQATGGLLDEIDLFMGGPPRKITPELADEVYNTFVRDVSKRLGRRTEEEKECDPHIYYNTLVEYVALQNLLSGKERGNASLTPLLERAKKLLLDCGFREERIVQEIETADGFFISQYDGHTFQEMVEAEEEKLNRRYGGENAK